MKGDVNSLPPTARAREKPAVLSWRARSGPARGVSPERRASGPTIPLTRLAMAKIERKDDSWQKPALRHIVMPARRGSREKSRRALRRRLFLATAGSISGAVAMSASLHRDA